MELLLYSADHPVRVRELKAAIRKAAPRQGIAIYKTPDELKVRLLQPRRQLKIAILKVVSKGDLESLLPLRDLLLDLRVVLILPDHDGATVSLAHRLGPRYLSYPENDGEDFGRVLGNMIRLYR